MPAHTVSISAGDTAWVLLSAALVFFMVPGLALFYGGLVRTQNVVATMVQCFAAVGVITVLWVAVGYTLVFGDHPGGFVGGLGHVMLHNVGPAANAHAPRIPGLAFMLFQLMFAVITPRAHRRRVCGADDLPRLPGVHRPVVAARLRAARPCGVGVGGWLGASGLGAIDFAGGAVIHESAGAAALAAALYFGPRAHPVNRPFSVPMGPPLGPAPPASSGSAGSGSTVAAPSPPATSRSPPWSTPSSAQARACSPG